MMVEGLCDDEVDEVDLAERDFWRWLHGALPTVRRVRNQIRRNRYAQVWSIKSPSPLR